MRLEQHTRSHDFQGTALHLVNTKLHVRTREDLGKYSELETEAEQLRENIIKVGTTSVVLKGHIEYCMFRSYIVKLPGSACDHIGLASFTTFGRRN